MIDDSGGVQPGRPVGREAHRTLLSVMMFGQYVIMGTWAVTLSTYLMSPPTRGGLNFPAADTGWIYSTMALAAIVAPALTGLLADRLFAAEKVMGFLHLLGAILLGTAAYWCLEQQPKIESAYRAAAAQEEIEGVPLLEMERRIIESPASAPPGSRRQVREALQRVNQAPEVAGLVRQTFAPLFFLMFVYSFCNIIGITLSNVIAFRNLRDPHESFGGVRLFGTVGWMVAGMHLEFFWDAVSATQLIIASGLSGVLGLFCFCLPHTPPSRQARSWREATGLAGLSILRDPSVRILILCAFAITAVQQFYGIYSNLFLKDLGTPYPAAVQTVAQVFEVICMTLAPLALARFGLKTTLALGLGGWIVRNSIFASQSLPMIVLAGLPLHGLSYAFFIMIGSMYVDRKAPLRARASAQAIFTLATMGIGPLLGNWLSAQVMEACSAGDMIDWSAVWMWPAGISGLVLALYLIFFREVKDAALAYSPPGNQ